MIRPHVGFHSSHPGNGRVADPLAPGVQERGRRWNHLGSEHGDASPLADALPRRSAALVTPQTVLVADATDLAKYYARHMEGLGRVHDGSDPQGRTAPGYALFEGSEPRWAVGNSSPPRAELLKTYAGASTSENAEIERHLLTCQEALGGQGTGVLDRCFDRRNLFGPLVRHGVAFAARQVSDRHVRTADGRTLAVRTWPTRCGRAASRGRGRRGPRRRGDGIPARGQ